MQKANASTSIFTKVFGKFIDDNYVHEPNVPLPISFKLFDN